VDRLSLSLLDVLGSEDRRLLDERAVRHRYERGDVVFLEGDPTDALHLIEEGRVAVRATTVDGEVATFTVLGPGATFGELTMTEDDSVRSATIEALEAVTTLAIGRREFEALRTERPSIDRFVVAVLAEQVKRLTTLALEALYLPAEARLERRLGDLARLYDTGGRPIVVPLTQADIATMAGTTRPTANQVLKRLESEGHLRVHRGRIELLDDALG
jgi:CRP/FNR family transcriptional regulator, cyclic AMP receptor protein